MDIRKFLFAISEFKSFEDLPQDKNVPRGMIELNMSWKIIFDKFKSLSYFLFCNMFNEILF